MGSLFEIVVIKMPRIVAIRSQEAIFNRSILRGFLRPSYLPITARSMQLRKVLDTKVARKMNEIEA